MHDSKSGSAKFTSHFNGNTRDTIRFIFAIQRFETVSRFMDPDSLFHAVYNNIGDTIKSRFAADKATTISMQQAALPDNPSAEQKQKAAMYSATSMQKFFMTHYRPSITRGKIYGQLIQIRMRYNENPREVLDRVVTAIGNAQRTIGLYNEGAAVKMQKILVADKTHILTTVFCSRNNSEREKNNGGINALVQKVVRDKELQYTKTNKYRPWYDAIETLVSKIGGVHYASDERYKYVHHEPQLLELWDKPKSNKHKPTRKPTPTKRRNPYKPNNPKPKYQRRDNNSYRRQSPSRPYKTNKSPSNSSTPNTPTCWRCGRIGHAAWDCWSKTDINKQSLRNHERRELSQMPFRTDRPKDNSAPNKPKQPYSPRRYPSRHPSSPTKPSYNPNTRRPNGPRQNPRNPSWAKYPSSNPTQPQHNPNNAPQRQIPTHSQPQIHTLLAEMQANAASNPHTDPTLYQQLQSLQSMLDPENGSSGHDPQRPE